jgi:hypothetical protein
MDKFDNKYRIESARLLNWDYGSNAYYFVTICTGGREHFFFEIVNSEMVVNEIGKIVEYEWIKTPIMRPDMNLKMREFIVMPNHFHAIVYIGKNQFNSLPDIGKDEMYRISANKNKPNKFGPQSKNLSSIIRGFKSSVTKEARKYNPDFAWQSRFHDRIIRDKDEWYSKTNYIINNPKNWNDDKFNIDGL